VDLLEGIEEVFEVFFLHVGFDGLVEFDDLLLCDGPFLSAEGREEDAHRALVFRVGHAGDEAILFQFLEEAGEAARLHTEERRDFGGGRALFAADVEQGKPHCDGDALLIGRRAKHACDGQPSHLDIETDVNLGEDGVLLISDQRCIKVHISNLAEQI
jgi:hypothetical protein